ncbi:MAG: efflux RND transporter permease subunit, partial [Epsilonproteobacteria bacterium]|nr:efflux RND transporter permease subunit [Campylobacterota bacterium]
LGKTTYQACLDGVSEILPVLFASMLTTVVAFLPLMMLSGGLGLFVKIIPLMVIILIISSFLESFIFLPLHYLNVDQKFSDKQRNWRDQFWDVINRQYQKSLYWMMRWRYSALVIFVVMTLVLTVVLSKSAKFQLFPEFDAMSIYVTGKVKHNDTKFTAKQTELLESLFLAKLNPEDVASVHTLVGMKTDGRGSHEKAKNLFTITLNLHPKRSEDFFNRVINPWFVLFGDVKQQPTRKLAAKELRREIEKIFTEYSSQMDDFVHTSINIPQTGVVQSDIAIQISDHDDQKIHETLGVLKDEIAKIEGVYNIKDDMKYDNIDLQIDINSYGKQLGFTQMDIIRSLRLYVEKDKFSKVLTRENEFVELKAGFLSTNNLDSFTNLQLRVPQSEKRVVLNDIATLWYIKKATVIKKENFEKRYTLQASLDKKIITSRVFYKKMNPLLKRLKNEGIKIIIKGEAQKKKEMQKDILKSVIFSLFGILLILTWVFKSFRLSLYALTPILLSLPGIFIGHMILGLNLTLSSILGGVGLIGIIVNDTALMLSFLQKSKDLNSLIAQATLRVKPILITSITTMLGFSTLIFFASGESLLMQPLAVSIGFGLIWATVVNLFYLPLGYSLGR